jgi:hypothetical protein
MSLVSAQIEKHQRPFHPGEQNQDATMPRKESIRRNSRRGCSREICSTTPMDIPRALFRGGLSWPDNFRQGAPFLIGRTMLQPMLYIRGSDDAVVEFARPCVDNLEKSVPNLWMGIPAKPNTDS